MKSLLPKIARSDVKGKKDKRSVMKEAAVLRGRTGT